MAALAWLLIPLMAAIGAALWGSWAARNPGRNDGPELAGYARFRAAMAKSHGDPDGADPALPADLPATDEREQAHQPSDGPAPAVR
ncbi:hypothetical protein KQH42_09345 [Streptomyces sp. CHA1]|uniref:hypothetical protein n=1 Tax=Streptomyces TaxID=1883 RepID=UPI0002DDD513|nr:MULTISPECIES: hypothetical protein [Streptomyces]QOZ99280.1 hypothetical protein DI273_09180 [Streptomyces violascens]ESP99831.1 Hypothetical protein B591_08935 [Streptomyces sp. GBA 94-10 4N24]ESQ05888.1 Hypothetical protein B590_09075 [Streptomyces sp. PVA_94-07]MBP3077388.1 hypothetical protein [Streptomyces sp. 604F]MBT3157418.1 hypothetical protein [Streptomyces sp. G11C]